MNFDSSRQRSSSSLFYSKNLIKQHGTYSSISLEKLISKPMIVVPSRPSQKLLKQNTSPENALDESPQRIIDKIKLIADIQRNIAVKSSEMARNCQYKPKGSLTRNIDPKLISFVSSQRKNLFKKKNSCGCQGKKKKQKINRAPANRVL